MRLTRLQKANLVKFLYKLGAFVATLQLLLSSSQFGAFDASKMAIFMGFISIVSGITTALYQYLHDSIPNRVANTGLIMSLITICGGFNEWIKILPISGQLGVNITFAVTVISFGLQSWSKMRYVPK